MLKKMGIILGLSLALITNIYADNSDDLLNDIGILDDTDTTSQNTNSNNTQQNSDSDNTLLNIDSNNTQPNIDSNNTQSLPTLNYISNGDEKKIEVKIDKNNSNFIITFSTGENSYIINDVQLFNGLTGENITDSLSVIMKNISIVQVNSDSNDIHTYHFNEINSDNGIVIKPTDKIYIIGELNQEEIGTILNVIGENNLVIKMKLNNPNYLGKLINQSSFEFEKLYKYNELKNAVEETITAKNEKEVKKQVTGSSDYFYGALLLLLLLIIGFYYNNKESDS